MSIENEELKKEIENLKFLIGEIAKGGQVKVVYYNNENDANYAFINKETNMVENIIIWHPESSWQPPENILLVKIEEGMNCRIGMSYIGGEFIKNEEEPPQE